MTRRTFTLTSAISLSVSFLLVGSPRLVSAGHFWLSTPLGDFGPFDNADESFFFGSAILFAMPAVLWIRLALNRLAEAAFRHRPAEGCCQNCGYDLRATPRRCPECGSRGHALNNRRWHASFHANHHHGIPMSS